MNSRVDPEVICGPLSRHGEQDRAALVVDSRDQRRVMVTEASLQRLLQLGQLGPQPTLGQLGQRLDVTLPGDQRVQRHKFRSWRIGLGGTKLGAGSIPVASSRQIRTQSATSVCVRAARARGGR